MARNSVGKLHSLSMSSSTSAPKSMRSPAQRARRPSTMAYSVAVRVQAALAT